MKKKGRGAKNFEDALTQLEGIVERLESGELSLEESLAAFGEGVELVKYCNQKLSDVEAKIEVLVKDKEGQMRLKPFADVEDEGDS